MPDLDFTPALTSAADFKRDRLRFVAEKQSRITYMAHGKGYVMVRHPGCIPFAIPEKEWRELPIYRPAHP